MKAGGTPLAGNTSYYGGDIPFVTIEDMTACSKRLRETKSHLTAVGLASSNAWMVPAGALLYSMYGSLGKVRINEIPVATNQAILAILPDNKKIDSDYLYYFLESLEQSISRYSSQTTQANLNAGILKNINVKFPKNPEEQRRIANILSVVDLLIEETEALIAKHQQIKAGLMHDLLQSGVLPNGQIRPSHAEAPSLYQETPIGWMPNNWDCSPIESLLSSTACPMRSGPFGSALLKNELIEDGIPLLGIDNIHRERFISEYSRCVSEEKYRELQRYAVLPGDVVITIMGTVGRCCVLPSDIGRALSSKHLWTMTFDQSRVLPDLVCWQLNYAPWVLAWFARHAQGAVMDAIQSETLKRLKLPIPPIFEQRLIRDMYLTCQSHIRFEEDRKQKLIKEKNGLMRELLAGHDCNPVGQAS
jgi:type I restriction enzyme S subunit